MPEPITTSATNKSLKSAFSCAVRRHAAVFMVNSIIYFPFVFICAFAKFILIKNYNENAIYLFILFMIAAAFVMAAINRAIVRLTNLCPRLSEDRMRLAPLKSLFLFGVAVQVLVCAFVFFIQSTLGDIFNIVCGPLILASMFIGYGVLGFL